MTLQLDHPTFGRCVAEVRAETAELDESLARLSRRVDAALDGWHGAAATSYAEAWTSWRHGAAEVRQALEAIADVLAATHADLTETDAVGAERSDRLRARLR